MKSPTADAPLAPGPRPVMDQPARGFRTKRLRIWWSALGALVLAAALGGLLSMQRGSADRAALKHGQLSAVILIQGRRIPEPLTRGDRVSGGDAIRFVYRGEAPRHILL